MDFGIWIALGVSVMAVLVVLVAMPFYFFSYAFLRKVPTDLADPEQTKGTPYAPLSEEIGKGKQWAKEQGHEDWWTVSDDGLKLHGYFFPHPEPKGILLMLHGYHSEAVQDFACVLPYYHSLGYHMLIVDQRAHGLSEGEYITFGHKEKDDVVIWLKEIVTRFGPNFPIFLDGISMGSTTVMMAASLKLPGNVRGVIADCGYTSPTAEFTHVLRTQFHLPAWPLVPLVQKLAIKRMNFRFDSVDTIKAMETMRRPILFIHGLDDDFVPPEMTKANYDACKSPKTLYFVEGAAHGGSYLADTPRCQRALERFLEINNPRIREMKGARR